MKFIKTLILGIILGGLAGLWFGINIGKNNPWYSNPLAESSVTDSIKSSFGEGVEKAGESIEKMGEDLQNELKN